MLAPVYPHAYGPTNFLWFCDAALLLTVAGMWMESSLLFDPHLPLFTRGLSLCHAWLPVLLVWLLFRVGYDRRALNYWIILAAMLMAVGYLFTPPAGAHPVDPNQPINLN